MKILCNMSNGIYDTGREKMSFLAQRHGMTTATARAWVSRITLRCCWKHNLNTTCALKEGVLTSKYKYRETEEKDKVVEKTTGNMKQNSKDERGLAEGEPAANGNQGNPRRRIKKQGKQQEKYNKAGCQKEK